MVGLKGGGNLWMFGKPERMYELQRNTLEIDPKKVEKINWKCFTENGSPLYYSDGPLVGQKVYELTCGMRVRTRVGDVIVTVPFDISRKPYAMSDDESWYVMLDFDDTYTEKDGQLVTEKCWKVVGLSNWKAIQKLELYESISEDKKE